MLIASTFERLLEELWLGGSEVDTEVGVEVAIAVMVTGLDRLTLEELIAVEADAGLVPEVADLVDVGGVAVKRAVAAVGNTSLASPLMRVQKSGRRPD